MKPRSNGIMTLIVAFLLMVSVIPLAFSQTVQHGLDAERTFASDETGDFDKAPDIKWSFDSGNHERYGRLSTPAIADVNGDGLKEIFLASGDGRFFALDHQGKEIWNFSTGSEWLFAPPSVGDLDGNGDLEVVFGGYKMSGRGDSHVYALNAEDGSILWTFDTYRGTYLSGIEANPVLIDVNGDGAQDVLLSSDNYFFYILDGKTGEPLFSEKFEHFLRASIPLGDVDLDGKDEFLVADNHALARLYEVGGEKEWEIHTGYNTAATPSFAQLDEDPELEIVIFNVGWGDKSGKEGAAQVFEHDGSLKWRNIDYRKYYASPAVVDVDSDGISDLVGVTYFDAQLVAFRGYDGTVLWSKQLPGKYYGSGPVAFDANGDGKKDLLFPGKVDLHLLDSSDGSAKWIFDTNGTAPGGLIVADLEDDGSPEIMFTMGPGVLVCLGEEPVVQAVVDFDPDSFNMESRGRFVTVYVEFPGGENVEDIDVSTVKLNGELLALEKPTGLGDYDDDGIPDLMVKFDAEEAKGMLDLSNNSQIDITGNLNDGTAFYGFDVINVFSQGGEGKATQTFAGMRF